METRRGQPASPAASRPFSAPLSSSASARPAVVSALNVASIVFVLCAGFPQAETANLAPFSPYGAEGVFKGAAVVFFSFIGEPFF